MQFGTISAPGLGAANGPKLLLNVLFPGRIFLLFHFRGAQLDRGGGGDGPDHMGRGEEEVAKVQKYNVMEQRIGNPSV